MIINSSRFASAGGTPTPLHWWDLDSLTITDQGNGTTFDLDDVGTGVSVGGTVAPDGGASIDLQNTTSNDYLENTGGGNIAWDGATDNMSVAIWGRADTLSSVGNMLMNWRAASTSIINTIFFQNLATDAYTAVISDDADTVNVTTTTAPTYANATWFHLVQTMDVATGDHKLYINGVLRDTNNFSYTGVPTEAVPFAIGRIASSNTNDAFAHNGRVWCAGIWDEVLTADQINDDLYNAGNGNKYADLWT
jgi:hypothetical protein